jgi:pectate lyase
MDHEDIGGWPMEIASNKTIVGADKNATIIGGLAVNGVSNVIIRNLNIQGVYPNPGPGDTLSSRNSHHIWWDHLTVWDAEDGLLDITKESNYQTVSWCKFYYTDTSNGHRLASLNGSGGGDHPEDWGKLKVTYHHNWWGDLVTSRMPRVVYGEGHQFNNYFNSPGNSYCIGVGSYGSILVENNYFKDVNNPHQFMYEVYMYASAIGNIYDNTSGARDTGSGGSRDACPDGDCSIQENFDPGPFEPPYEYTLRTAAEVPDIVQRCAGPQ